MSYRKTRYRLYPSAAQTAQLEDILGIHCRLYNAALETRIAVYQETGKSLSFAEQCRMLTQWRREVPALARVNSSAEQVTLKRLDLAFQHFFRRLKNGETPGFPRFKSTQRFHGWGYKQHGSGWRFIPGLQGKHGTLWLSEVGRIPIRGKPRNEGIPKTCELLRKQGRWYVSVTFAVETIPRECGTEMGAFDWGVTDTMTIATERGTETVANPRHLRNQLAELRRLSRDVSRKIAAAQGASGKKTGYPVSQALRRAQQQLARLYAKIARQRHDFQHQLSSKLVSRFGALATESLDVAQMVSRKSGKGRSLRREIQDSAPSALLARIKYKAEEAGTWYEEAPTRELKPSQRCHACWRVPTTRKPLSQRRHHCDCGAECGRDENAARVLLRWLEAMLSGGNPETDGNRPMCGVYQPA